MFMTILGLNLPIGGNCHVLCISVLASSKITSVIKYSPSLEHICLKQMQLPPDGINLHTVHFACEITTLTDMINQKPHFAVDILHIVF